MSMIGKKVEEFTAQAYRNGEFIEVSEKNLRTYKSNTMN